MSRTLRLLALAAAFASVSASAVAADDASAPARGVYAGIGLPGVFVGYAEPITDKVGVRIDFATMGSHNKSISRDNIEYEGKFKADRVGIFADYFVSGGFRLTGGVTFNNAKADLVGRSTGGVVQIGGVDYAAGPDDRVDVKIKFPSTTPYIGLGYGYSPKADKGISFSVDLGISIGKPKVSGVASGPLLTNVVTQADVDRELEEVRDEVAKIKGIPQISVSLSYRF